MDAHIKKVYVPMTETGFYILLCLRTPNHGYGIVQKVKELTEDEVVLGPGTMYGSLSKMEKDGLIEFVREEEKRKNDMYLPRHIWFVLVVIMISSCSTETLDVTSPTGKLGVTVEPMEGKAYDKITFSVNYDGKTILSQTELGLETDVQKFYGNLKLKSVSKTKRIVDDYKMITGKRSHCINEAFERTYSFENQEGNTLDITFRVYDNGVVFRYEINTIADKEYVVDEYTAYNIPQGAKRWMQQYDPGYEKFFPVSTDGKLPDRPKVNSWGYPGLVELQDSVFMLITEANA